MTGVRGRGNFCKCDRWAYIETPTFFPRPHRAQINVSPITLSPSPRPTCLPAKLPKNYQLQYTHGSGTLN